MRLWSYAVALLCLQAAACSRTSTSETTSAAPSPSASAAGPTYGIRPDEIVLGEPAAFTGPSAGLGIEMWRGASAAFSAANDQGGVNGRKVRLVLADDAYDAEKAAAAVVSLVGQDVFAIFGGVGTPTIVRALPVVRKLYAESGLFYFANFTGAQPQRTPPSFEAVFNVRASYYQETKAIIDVYVAMGKKKIGTFVQDDAYGTDGRAGVEKALADHGMSLAVDTRYPRGQKFDASTNDQVGILKAAGVDAVVAIGSYQACGAFVRDAREGGWNVPIHNVSFVGADQLLSLLIAEEAKTKKKVVTNLVNTQVVPYYADTTVPAVVAYRAAIDHYQPDVPAGVSDGSYHPSAKYTFGSLEGYVSARAFLAVLDHAGKDLTRKGFYGAAEKMGQFDLGVGAPAELSPTRHQVLEKVWFTVATPDGWRPTETPGSMLK